MTRIGRAEAEQHQDIQLKGLGIANEHCIIRVEEREVFLTPVGHAKLVPVASQLIISCDLTNREIEQILK